MGKKNTLFFMVSTGGSILEGRRRSDQTYRYVGGITRVWETETGKQHIGARFFYERVPRTRGIRTLVHIENEGDVQDLAEQGRYHGFTNIYIVYTHQMGGNGNADDPSSSVGSN